MSKIEIEHVYKPSTLSDCRFCGVKSTALLCTMTSLLMIGRIVYSIAGLLWLTASAMGQASEPVRYTLRFPQPETHYVEVEASFPADHQEQIELMMPVWTPGSYLVRDYSRHVEGVAASAGDRALKISKTRKNRWTVETAGSARVDVRYRVYGFELSVQTNWIGSEFAMLNGAATFLSLAEKTPRPHEITVGLPPSWKTVATGLAEAPGGENHRFVAPDYDTVVDSPIVAGNPTIHKFEVGGKPHYLFNFGGDPFWDGEAAARDVRRIVESSFRLWSSLPYDKYVFLNVIAEASGGLEHKNSTLLLTSRWAYRIREASETGRPNYINWLDLVAHEFFHVWNVKRLRPVELGPFDYENEVYTKSLWVAEGLTSYYAPLVVKRAGLIGTTQFLRLLSRRIETLETTPGRLVQPVETSSYDAWIHLYRPNENTPNSGISYYTKGAVIGLLLDAKIRSATDGRKSLDDAMRLAYERYSGRSGFTPEEFRRVLAEAAGTDLEGWLKETLETAAELDYREMLEWFGLRWQTGTSGESEKQKPTTGLVTRADGSRLIVNQVRRGTPAYVSGVSAGDEILAVDGYRVLAEQWPSRMDQYKPGDQIELLISRRGELKKVSLSLAAEAPKKWRLEVKPDATDEQKDRLEKWLSN